MNPSVRIYGLVVLVALAAAVCGSFTALAQEESSLLVEPTPAQPELVPAMPTPAAPAPAEELATPAGAVEVHKVAEIDYDVTRRARRQFGGCPMVQLTMVTQNPADRCLYEIPLCLPACCTGEPQVTSRCGLLGRGVVEYCYECGLEVKVIFRLRGDVEVTYGA